MQKVSFIVLIGITLVCVKPVAQQPLSANAQEVSLLHRKVVVAAGTGLALGITTYGLSQAWYNEYDKVNFHWFDDSQQWLQMDKAGHFLSSYHFGMGGYNAFKWAGFSENTSLWIGGNTGFLLLLGVEYLDGKSSGWGASISDLASNTAGSLLFIGQEKIWHEQRITPKFSYRQSPYASKNPGLLGDGLQEEWLKDYNGQTYWLSFNIKSFINSNHIPAWLDLSLGYGGDGLMRGSLADQNSSEFANIQRLRQYYFSLDADLWRIPTQSKWLKTSFRVLSFVKIPFPGVRIDSKGGLKMEWLSF